METGVSETLLGKTKYSPGHDHRKDASLGQKPKYPTQHQPVLPYVPLLCAFVMERNGIGEVLSVYPA